MNMHSFLALLSALLISSSTSLASQTYITRIVVEKKMTPSAGDSTLSFSAITSEHPTRSGFSQLADYPSRTVFEGPAGSIPALMSGLRSEGYEVRVAEDLEELSFRGHRIDPSSGSATPPFPSLPYQASGKDGLRPHSSTRRTIGVCSRAEARTWMTSSTRRSLFSTRDLTTEPTHTLISSSVEARLSSTLRLRGRQHTTTKDMEHS